MVNTNKTANATKLSFYSSNGFLKTSGGDGTLSIDTATYLQTVTAIDGGAAATVYSGDGGIPTLDGGSA